MHAVNTRDERQWLLTRLSHYARYWPNENVTSDIQRFVAEQPNCFERNCFSDGHVTGSAWIVCPQRERVLLTHHRKLNRWLQLGGHSDGDANTYQVAQREAQEESSVVVRGICDEIFDVDIHVIPGHCDEPEHKHYDVRFLFEADANEPLAVSAESHDLRWVQVDRIHAWTTEESVLRMVRKLNAYVGSL